MEKDVKTKTKGETGAAKTLCSPFEQPELPEGIIFKLQYFLLSNKGIFVFCTENKGIYVKLNICDRYLVLCIWETCQEMDILGPKLLTKFKIWFCGLCLLYGKL